MKKLVILIPILILSLCIKSQNVPNPYSSIGKEAPKVVTMTNGDYDEFHLKESLVLINGDAVDRKTGELVYSKENEPEMIASIEKKQADKFRFLSVDALTRSFPWYTPYQFAGNSPIQAIDLDGLEEYNVSKTYAYNNSTGKAKLAVVITYNDPYYPGGTNNQRRESSPGAADWNRKADITINGARGVHNVWPTTYGYLPTVETQNVQLVDNTGSFQDLPLSQGKGMTFRDPARMGAKFINQKANIEFDKTTKLVYETNMSYGAVAEQALDTYVDVLLSNPELSATITGNTSRKGTTESNLALSQARANDVLAKVISIATSKGATADQISNLQGRINTVAAGESNSTNVEGSDVSSDRNVTFDINLPSGTRNE